MKAAGHSVPGFGLKPVRRVRRWHAPLAVLFVLCWTWVLFLSPRLSRPRHYDDDYLPIRTSSSLQRHAEQSEVSTVGGPLFRRPDRKASFRPEPVAELEGYSIKPIVYVYPQFHSFPENDMFFGENYTDWSLVATAVLNSHGLKTIRPIEDVVGYYDLLNVTTRQRWTNMVSESL